MVSRQLGTPVNWGSIVSLLCWTWNAKYIGRDSQDSIKRGDYGDHMSKCIDHDRSSGKTCGQGASSKAE